MASLCLFHWLGAVSMIVPTFATAPILSARSRFTGTSSLKAGAVSSI
jgi:hypothetical protein